MCTIFYCCFIPGANVGVLALSCLCAQMLYEYIACQQARQGVMILSEFAGAAQSLNGSIVVNPWDSQQVADAIHEAVTTDPETRADNHRKLFKVRLPDSRAFCFRLGIRLTLTHRSTSRNIRLRSGGRLSCARWQS